MRQQDLQAKLSQDQQFKDLVDQVELGEKAEEVRTLLHLWLKACNEAIIKCLKTCPVQEMVQYRNLLRASEGFSSYLDGVINNKLAAQENIDDMKRDVQRIASEVEWDDEFGG